MYYFASDTHLGHGEQTKSRERERMFVEWLESVSHDAKEIFLLGDIFDFWYEYKRVVPKGFIRTLSTLATLSERGIKIHFFAGNHDMWLGNYLAEECGVIVHTSAEIVMLGNKRVYLAHGDEIYAKYLCGAKIINAIFRCGWVRWLFSRIVHPDLALKFGHWWSGHSRKSKAIAAEFLGEDDFMVREARKITKEKNIDYFIFGHNHCAEDYSAEGIRALFLGHWLGEEPVYAVLNEEGKLELKKVKA